MIPFLVNDDKRHEFINLNSIPKNIGYGLFQEDKIDGLFNVINKLYKNVYKKRITLAYSDLNKYKIISYIPPNENLVIINLIESDLKIFKSLIHKIIFSINYYYLKVLVPSNISITDEFRFDLWDAYYTILFRILNPVLNITKMDLPEASLLYFIIGRVFSTKIIPIDYNSQIKKVNKTFKFVSSKLNEIPEYVDFETMLELIFLYEISTKNISLNNFRRYVINYMYSFGESIIDDPYYFLSYINSYKVYSPIMNVNFRRYNPIVFNRISKTIFKEWYSKV